MADIKFEIGQPEFGGNRRPLEGNFKAEGVEFEIQPITLYFVSDHVTATLENINGQYLQVYLRGKDGNQILVGYVTGWRRVVKS